MENMNRITNVIVRMNDEEKRSAVKNAHRHEMTLSQYIRYLLSQDNKLLARIDQMAGRR